MLTEFLNTHTTEIAILCLLALNISQHLRIKKLEKKILD